MAYLFGFLSDAVKIIQEDDGYVVQRVRVGGNEYLEMYGRLNSGISFIIFHFPIYCLHSMSSSSL